MIVETKALTKSFGKKVVLDGLDLAVPEGAVYGLIGSNGSGKSTTIKLLLNIIRAGSGQASVLGVECRRLRPEHFQRIGYVSENQEMPEWMTAGAFLRYLRPFYPNWDSERESDLIDRFALPLEQPIRALSRGQRMKVALASSLAYRPELLILDEPFSGLDPLVREELIEGLLGEEGSLTILLSSHDLADVEGLVSHVGFLDRGRIAFSEEMRDLTERFREIEVVLEGAPPLPARWPEAWLGAKTAAAVVRFVDSRFTGEASLREVQGVFPSARDIRVHPMSLRAIFVALAKQERERERQAAA